MDSRRARVRKALGKSILTRSNGTRKLLNNYETTQNAFNNLMYPRSSNTSNSGIEHSSRFLGAMTAPLKAAKNRANINFLTTPTSELNNIMINNNGNNNNNVNNTVVRLPRPARKTRRRTRRHRR
jgi:hypothetical protein